MVALFDMALGLGCACCNPFPYEADVPDILCHQCKKVLYSTKRPPEQAVGAASAANDLDLTPRS